MHQLYVEKCASDGERPQNLKFYRDIFAKEFNLAFHKPKRDQCNYCTTYKNSSKAEQEKMQENFSAHHKRKEYARELKQLHKTRAQQDSSFHVVCFDLEQVLQCPKLNVSALYYKRKL